MTGIIFASSDLKKGLALNLNVILTGAAGFWNAQIAAENMR